MDDIVYSGNPNEDSVQAQIDGKFRKVSLTRSIGDTEVIYQDNPNVDKVLFTGEDGKKHTATLTASIGNAEVIYQNNPNVDKVLFTGEDGKKHTATLVKEINGGATINNEDISVTANGTYTASEGYTGLGTVSVSVPNPSTGTKSITANGVYDVTDFASADVQVPTTAPAHYIEKTVDANGKLVNGTNIINLNGATDVSNGVLAYAYYQTAFPANTSVDLSLLITMSGFNACGNMFSNCTGITSVDLSGLTTISGGSACQYMFYNCTGLTSADLSGLTTISDSNACDNMFYGCTGLTSIDLSGLTTISGNSACNNMFSLCRNITSVDLSGLTTLSGSYACSGMFGSCTSLATVYIGGTTAIDFGTYKNQFANMFRNCTQNIDVYAPAANQAQIEAFSGYPKFAASGTVTWHWRS